MSTTSNLIGESPLYSNQQFCEHESLVHEIVKNEDIFNEKFLKKFRKDREEELKENLEKYKTSRLNQYFELVNSGKYYFTPEQKQEFLENDDFDIENCSMYVVMKNHEYEYWENEEEESKREYWEQREQERLNREEDECYKSSGYNNEGYYFKGKFYHWNQ